jgi:polysaccharide pyruvyl transferase WcaK-like protein
MGVDTSADRVYPDLAFALPSPPVPDTTTGAVGVGVMAFRGRNSDREHAEELHARYLSAMKRFVRWLVESGRPVRLFTGDRADEAVVAEVLADLRDHPPAGGPPTVIADPVDSLEDLMRELAHVDTVVATRYHNVLCALKMSRPTVSIGYAAKHDALMADMGLAGFCESARSVDVERLIEQFSELENRSAELRRTLVRRNRANEILLERQFGELSSVLFGEDPHDDDRRSSEMSRST